MFEITLFYGSSNDAVPNYSTFSLSWTDSEAGGLGHEEPWREHCDHEQGGRDADRADGQHGRQADHRHQQERRTDHQVRRFFVFFVSKICGLELPILC